MNKLHVTLDHYVTFLKVAETHRIDHAAKELGLSESAVRKQIELTQSMLGTRLFEHHRGAFVLTGDGQAFYEDASRLIHLAELAEGRIEALRQMRARKLRLGHSTNLPARLIAAVHQMRLEDSSPVSICHTSGLTSTVLRQVVDGSLHAGIGVLPVSHAELMVHRLYEEPLLVAMAPGHRLAPRPAIVPQQLDGELMIAISRDPWPERHREIEEHLAQFGAMAPVVADAYSASEALALVERGVGLCLVAPSAISQLNRIVLRPLTTSALKRRYGIFFREDSDSPLLHALTEAARQLCSSSRFSTQDEKGKPLKKVS